MDTEKPYSSTKRKLGTSKKRSRFQFDNGKRRRRNSSDGHTSTTPKAIDTMYRVLCPSKKIGSVLGKGGEIVNALRDETRAKIRVADAIPGAEERVVIIFSYPSKQPGESDTDQDPENANPTENEYEDMQPHCPAQFALLKVHDRIVADEYLHGGVVHEKTEVDGDVTARILVPNNQVGCLLGKGGTVIRKLRSDTGASIRILPADQLPLCAMETDELVQISGLPVVVKKGLYEVSTLLHQHPRKENPPLEELIYASTQGLFHSGASMPPLPQGDPVWSHQRPGTHATAPMPWFGGRQNEPSGYGPGNFNSSFVGNDGETMEFSMRILCDTGKIGGVIGKGGVNVKQLEQQTGAKIQVEDTAPEAEERIILVTSKEALWEQMSPTIEAVLQLQSRTSGFSDQGIVTTRLLVPSNKVGCILGQGGNIITEMRRRTRADIRVCSKDDKPKYTSDNEELVQISGNLNVAKEALLEIASRLRTRTLRAGNAAGNPAPSGPLHGLGPSESMSGRGLPPYGIMGAGSALGYEHSKAAGPRHEAQGYPGPPSATGYSAGPRHAAQGYLDLPPPATGYSAGPRHASQGYLDPPPATGYSAGQRHAAQSYLDPPTATGYSVGPKYETQSYPGPPTATGYSAGPRYEGQGYPTPADTAYGPGARHEAQLYQRPPTAVGYSAGPKPETQSYTSPAATGYAARPRHETHGYPDPPAATGYTAGPRYDGPAYPGQQTATGGSAAPRHEAQGYPGKQTATGYSAAPRHEAPGYPGLQTATGYSAAPRHEALGYLGPPNATGYSNMSSSIEVKIPSSAVPYVLGTGGSNISDIRQISGARVKLHDPLSGASECVVEIHGSSEQMKAAQSLLQSFIASGGQNAPPSQHAPYSY